MDTPIDEEWRHRLLQMPPEEQEAFLRAVYWLRAYCPRCPVKEPQLYREPCYMCTTLPGHLMIPNSTVN